MSKRSSLIVVVNINVAAILNLKTSILLNEKEKHIVHKNYSNFFKQLISSFQSFDNHLFLISVSRTIIFRFWKFGVSAFGSRKCKYYALRFTTTRYILNGSQKSIPRSEFKTKYWTKRSTPRCTYILADVSRREDNYYWLLFLFSVLFHIIIINNKYKW